MLGTIRDKVTGWIASIIVGLLIISFAFWGVSFYFGKGGNVNVASVNGSDISLQAFQRSFYNLRQQMKSVFGEELSVQEEELIKEQTLQKLINSEVIDQIVEDNDLRVSNEQVLTTIHNIELFQGKNGFDRAKYEQGILSLGMQPAFFERQLRNDLLSEQLQAGLSESLFVLDSELNSVIRLKSQTRDITYSILSIDNYLDDMEVSDSDIENYYKSNPGKYAEPEKVKIAYIELDVEELAKNVETNEEDLRNYYNDNKDTYDVAEQRSVTKLFVRKNKDATEEDKAKAREVIESANTLVKQGKTFEEVIKEFQKEGKSMLEFSEHAFMTKGIMDKEIDDFLFSANENDVSDIIETKNGFNIIKVGEIRGGPKNNYENVAEQVEHDYRHSQAELQFFELSDQLATLSYEHPDTLEIAAETTGQSVHETGFFSRNSEKEGVLANSKVIAASFKPELISSGINSDAIELSDNHIVVLRVLEHKAPSTKPLEEVKEQVIADVKQEKAAEKVKKLGESIVEQLKIGKTTEDINSDLKIEWINAENVKRDDVNVNRSVLRHAFELGRPEGKSRIAGQRLGSGDYAVIIVTAAHDGTTEVAEDVSKATDIELRKTRGTTEWQEFLKNARDNADVKIFKENI